MVTFHNPRKEFCIAIYLNNVYSSSYIGKVIRAADLKLYGQEFEPTSGSYQFSAQTNFSAPREGQISAG